MDWNTSPRKEAIASVSKHYNAITESFPDAEANFERRWHALQAACIAQAASNASAEQCIELEEFNALKRLGPKIVQFVVFTLAKDIDENHHLVFLYNAIENDKDYRVSPIAEDGSMSSADTLRRLAKKIVELNYQRNLVYEERVKAWIAHHNDNWLQSSSAFFTLCEEYWDLLEMGTSIIAPLMVEYAHLDWGYWFQLLHEIVHGQQLWAHSFQKSVLQAECFAWFIEGEHSEAPRYIPTEMDRYIFPNGPPGQVY